MHRAARTFLMVVSILNGSAGLICGVLLVARPDGDFLQMGALLPVIEKMPLADIFFRDFLWIGVAMLVALGIPGLIAAVMLFRRSSAQYLATLVAGVLLILWCGYELIYMFNVAAVGYLIVGVAAVLASELLRTSAARPDPGFAQNATR